MASRKLAGLMPEEDNLIDDHNKKTPVDMNDIEEILRALLDRYSNTRQLDNEFARMRREDASVEEAYIQWCEDNGLDVESGYREFVNEIVESQDSYWDSYREFGNDI